MSAVLITTVNTSMLKPKMITDPDTAIPQYAAVDTSRCGGRQRALRTPR